MPATIQDVANKAGVAVGTVFRHLNGAQLREENRLKVEGAIEELGFRTSVSAIAVLIGNFTSAFSTSIIRFIERHVANEGHNIIISEYENEVKLLREKLMFFKNRSINGLILFPAYFGDECRDLLEEYAAAKIPVIVVNEPISNIGIDTVLVDNAHASFRAVEHLIQQGHQQIAILNGPKYSYVAQERFRGYMEALQIYRIEPEESWILWGDFMSEGSYASTKKLFKSSNIPSALYTTNYETTLGALIAINELQVKIPEELSLVGFDHFTAVDLIKPPLTVIEQPMDLIGETVGNMILQRITGDYASFPQLVKLKTRMLIRDSVAPLA